MTGEKVCLLFLLFGFKNCEAPVLTLIQNENVEIDVAFWFMDDDNIEHALIKKAQAGVKIRMLVDPRANPARPENATTLANFASVIPPIPMRKRIANGILHWKTVVRRARSGGIQRRQPTSI